MSTEIDIIIPAAGDGSRFKKAGYKLCKPLIDVNGKTMLNCVMENILTNDKANFHILLRKEHIDLHKQQFTNFKKNLKDINVNLIEIDKLTDGAARTVLYASSNMSNNELIIANSDQIVDFNINDFIKEARNKKLDGNIVVFEDETLDKKWSYVKIDDNTKLVTEVAEKIPISNLATVGIYYFNNGISFVKYCNEMINKNIKYNNEFYLCPVYNQYILHNKKIGIYKIDKKQMHGLGTPEDLKLFLKDNENNIS